MDEQRGLTLYEDEFYGGDEAGEKTVMLVVFRVASEWYAVEITSVREVVNFEKISYLPSSPEHIVGIFNLRGNILSVTDLKKLLGLPAEELTARSRLVIVRAGVYETALLVDEVAEPMEVPVSRISPALVTIAADRAEFLSGAIHQGKRFIGILRVDKLFCVKAG
ncbi:MAG: chemotaxis protein CheW [Candidatus Omnitrophica bacterium]|nr:chemotaxis protein CheW [Candidatus Omnitrophota bacterium]